MKRTAKWLLGIASKALVIILVILLLPFGRMLFNRLFPDVSGEIAIQTQLIEQKLEASSRLEVTRIEEEGIIDAKTNVIILGTVGSTNIRYRYTASLGIDLSRITVSAQNDRIIFQLPDPEILNDGIEALEVNRNDLFSRAIDKSVETLLIEQREKCRDTYLQDPEHSEACWEHTRKAFEETLCQWLDEYGERHYQFEFVRQSDGTAL